MTKSFVTSMGARRVLRVAVLTIAAIVGLRGAAVAQSAPAPDIQMQRLPNGRVVVEVADARVSIRKEIAGASSHVTITTPNDDLQIRVEAGRITVSSPAGSASMGPDAATAVDGLLAVLQRSTAAADARALLRRLRPDQQHLGYQALQLTRAVLELGTGTREAIRQWASAVPASARPARVITIGQKGTGDRLPGECWDIYAAETVRINEEYQDCLSRIRWYELHLQLGCGVIFTIRAEAAMFWLISCSGGFPFGGL